MTCGGCKKTKDSGKCTFKAPNSCYKGGKTCCDKKKLGCKAKNGECRSRYITEAAERIDLRKNHNLCCPIEPCHTKCNGVVCPTTKKLGKIVCNIKDKVQKLECDKCQPCKKGCKC